MDEELVVTLKVSDLKSILSEMIDKKLRTIKDNSSSDKKAEDLPELITRQRVSELFGVSLVSIDKWRKYKLLPPTIKQSGRTYFLRKEIEQFLINKINKNK